MKRKNKKHKQIGTVEWRPTSFKVISKSFISFLLNHIYRLLFPFKIFNSLPLNATIYFLWVPHVKKYVRTKSLHIDDGTT